MKKSKIIMLLPILLFLGCKKKEEVLKFLSINISSINLVSDGGKTNINVTANTKWNAVSNERWVKLSPAEGAESGEIIVDYDANESRTLRNAEIVFTGVGVEKKIILVSQSASDFLEAPTGLSAIFNEIKNVVDINWIKVIGAESYRVFYSSKRDVEPNMLLGEVKEVAISDPIRNRFYKVKAIKGKIESESSSIAFDSPNPPAQLSAIFDKSSKNIKVSWAPVNNATGYRIYYSSSLNLPFKLIAEIRELSMLDKNRYGYYKISTIMNEIEGNMSDYITELSPVPSNLIAKYNTTGNTVNISWDLVPNATTYNIYSSESIMGEYNLFKSVTTTLTTDTKRNRYYQVSSQNKSGESNLSYKFSENGRENQAEPLIDIEGNTYKTVKIGKQIWMAENLRVTKTKNGSNISMIIGDSQWLALTNDMKAYSFYDNYITPKAVAISRNYGILYTWQAAKEACPDGWRLPTSADFYELFDYVRENAPSGDINAALKSTMIFWREPGTDDYGFSALPAGHRRPNDGGGVIGFDGSGINAYWWTDTPSGNNMISVGSYYYNGTINNSYGVQKTSGNSVRYIKN